MKNDLQESAVLVMPYFWDAFDYEPAVQPVAPELESWWFDEPSFGGFHEETATLEQARLRENYPSGEVTH